MGEGDMMIITTDCWSCGKEMRMAVAGDDDGNMDATPAKFDEDQIKLAESHGVVLKMVSSKTAEETYRANVCPYCDAFIGEWFIYARYYVPCL
jgi:hypothetical protein